MEAAFGEGLTMATAGEAATFFVRLSAGGADAPERRPSPPSKYTSSTG